MMIFTTSYERNDDIEIATVDELDAFLDTVAATGQQYGIQIAQGTITQWEPANKNDARDELPILELGIGHPERSYLIYYGEPFGWGINHDLPELAEHLAYNGGGESEERNPRRTRVSIDQAREAAREFIKTGQRPTNVDWFEPTDDD